MIVRTYGRRNRGFDRNDDPYRSDSLSQETETSQELFTSLPFSSQQSSSHWSSLDSEPNSSQEEPLNANSKRPRIRKRESNKKKKTLGFRPDASVLRSTSTLMETQEFGEMMEHVDEVNFSLDGLRRGQPFRIRRASLLSLLSICATVQQRRLLRTQGMAKTIVDAVLGLNFDDSPSNLAAAALFYLLVGDGQDEHLLESPSCIRFLIKLLKPITSSATEDKAPKIGSKLLALCKDTDIFRDTTKRLDSSSTAILSKVHEILVSFKDMNLKCEDESGIERPELTPKWIALLTMEKACLSKISLEDTFGTVRKSGGNFKEKLRELGGLDAVFGVARSCHSIMENSVRSSSTRESKDNMDPESLVLLLKCLKIMENATFLSNDNQLHLLGMKSNLDSQGSPRSFTELIISIIRTLSGHYLLKSSPTSKDKISSDLCDGTGHDSESALVTDREVNKCETIYISSSKSSSRENSFGKSSSTSQNSHWLSTSMFSCETITASMSDTCSLKTGVNSSTSGSCNGTLRSSYGGTRLNSNGSRKNFLLVERPTDIEDVKFDFSEDTQDPYAFDEDDLEPSKWDLLSGKQNVSRTEKSRVTYIDIEDDPPPITNQYEASNLENDQNTSSNHESQCSQGTSCPHPIDNENSSFLSDCLLTAVKVLMNLTNDNPVGCRQIARWGGLETLSSLIAGHYPSFISSSSFSSETKESTPNIEIDHKTDIHLTDQELDFLVAILGLLVNLVEKDGDNRSRLAAASVSLPDSEGSLEKTHMNVIPLLCSIFLANQGAGEAAEEGKVMALNDEASMLQGEREAEKMIVEAYSALLLAFLSTESMSIRDAIAGCLPNHDLAILVPVLERFVAFHFSLNMISPETHKVVSEVIESCKMP